MFLMYEIACKCGLLVLFSWSCVVFDGVFSAVIAKMEGWGWLGFFILFGDDLHEIVYLLTKLLLFSGIVWRKSPKIVVTLFFKLLLFFNFM